MSAEILDTIELLQNDIEQLEQNYFEAAYGSNNYVVTDNLNTRISILKNELSILEMRLLDELPSKMNLCHF